MDLEKMLQEKAATRAAQEADNRAKEEQQAQDAEKALLEKAAAEAEQEEQVRLEELRSKVAEFDNQIAQTKELRAELIEVHADASGGEENLVEQEKRLDEAKRALEALFSDEIYKSVLEGEGITTIDQLMAAEDFGETTQVKEVVEGELSVQTGRALLEGKIRERIDTEKKAKAALEAEKPEITLTYNELIEGLDERLERLEKSRKEVHWQTPEGQEAKKEELANLIEEKFGSSFQGYSFERDFWQEFQYGVSKLKPVELVNKVFNEINLNTESEAQLYGESDVESAVRDFVNKKIDRVLDERYRQEKGKISLESALEEITKLGEQWETFKNRLPGLRDKEALVRTKLQEYLEQEGDEERKLGILNYYQGGYDKKRAYSSTSAVELTNKILGSVNNVYFDYTTHDNRSLSPRYERGISPQDYLEQCASEYGFSYTNEAIQALASDQKKVPDAEKILSILDTTDKYYDAVIVFLESEETYDDFRDNQKSDIDPRNRKSALSKKYDRLPEVRTLESTVRKNQEELAGQKIEAYKQFEQAYEDEMVIRDYDAYKYKNGAAFQRIHSFEKQTKLSSELLNKLNARNLGLRESDELELGKFDLIYKGYKEDDVLLQSDRDKKQAKLQETIGQIDELNKKAKQEGNGLFGGKKRSRDAQITDLESQKDGEQQEVDVAVSKVRKLWEKDEELKSLRGILGQMDDAGLKINIPESVTVSELINIARTALESVGLSEEDEQFKKATIEFEAKRNIAAKRKEDTIRGMLLS